MPALVPGRCNWCGEKLRPDQAKLCSKWCRQQWDREMRVLGMKLAERLLHIQERRRGKPLDEIYRRAFSEAQRLPRNFMQRLRMTRAHYGWGKK
ncbi:MAG: hypothetical protein AAF479_15970 [Pseudomonadota bacterium]